MHRMKYRTLDRDGDHTFGQNKFLTAHEAVAQAILTRLRLLLGEWWENTEDGLPLFEKILGAYGADIDTVDLIFAGRIRETKNVKRLISYKSEFSTQTRVYSAHAQVDTVFGEVGVYISNYDVEVVW